MQAAAEAAAALEHTAPLLYATSLVSRRRSGVVGAPTGANVPVRLLAGLVRSSMNATS